MRRKDSATQREPIALAPGLSLAGLGVLAFSGTFPATSFALRGFDTLVVGAGRSVLAAGLAGICLLLARARRPSPGQWPRLVAVAAGCGIGFGVLSAIALGRVSASHAAVVTALLPLLTAVAAVVRAGERPSPAFWALSTAGAAVVVVFTVSAGGGSIGAADGLLLVALAVGAVGYAEGGALAREMPGWQVIAWGVILALPVSLPLTLAGLRSGRPHPDAAAVAGLAYVSGISMFLGFFAWYRGLAAAGIARASQLQLTQPFLTVAWAALLLGERPSVATYVTALLVVLCVAATQRTRATGGPLPAAAARGTGSDRRRCPTLPSGTAADHVSGLPAAGGVRWDSRRSP